eukprot:3409378-Amphidinium_carterae.3
MTWAVKESAIPAQVLPAVAFGKGVPLRMYEDNDACSSVVKSGYSPKLRHLVRTKRTSIGMLSEVLLPHEIGTAEILRIDSANQKADALTKPLNGDKFQVALDMLNIRAPNSDNNDSTKCLLGLEQFEDAIPPSTARGSKDLMTDEGSTTPPPMESDDLESEEVDATFDRTLNDASSFAHQVHHLPKNPLCRQCAMFKTKASPARVRKISLSEQALITEAFQGLQLDHKYMFGQSTPFLTVRDIFTGWIYAYPVADKSKPRGRKGVKTHHRSEIIIQDFVLAANTFNLAHFAITPERPQQSGLVERSNALASEPTEIYLQESALHERFF